MSLVGKSARKSRNQLASAAAAGSLKLLAAIRLNQLPVRRTAARNGILRRADNAATRVPRKFTKYSEQNRTEQNITARRQRQSRVERAYELSRDVLISLQSMRFPSIQCETENESFSRSIQLSNQLWTYRKSIEIRLIETEFNELIWRAHAAYA